MTKKQVRSLKKGGRATGVSSQDRTSGTEKKATTVQTPVQEKSAISMPARIIQFLREVRIEFDKVAWATRKETLTLTVATIALTFFISSYLGLVDVILSKLVGFLIN